MEWRGWPRREALLNWREVPTYVIGEATGLQVQKLWGLTPTRFADCSTAKLLAGRIVTLQREATHSSPASFLSSSSSSSPPSALATTLTLTTASSSSSSSYSSSSSPAPLRPKRKDPPAISSSTSDFAPSTSDVPTTTTTAATNASAAVAPATLASENQPKPLLVVVGDSRRDDLFEVFEEHKIPFVELHVYRTIQKTNIAAEVAKAQPDWLVFFSPSGVKAFSSGVTPELSPALAKIEMVAIGTTTAAASQDFKFRATAKTPSPLGLLAAIQEDAVQEL